MNKKFENIKKASIIGITCNLFLLIIKGIIAFLTNSQAMIADSLNSASDIFSSIMTYIGNKISSKPSDDVHNLGYGKAEYLYSMLISITMFLLALKTLSNTLISIVKPTKYNYSNWLIIVCLITIIIKFLLFIYTNKLSKQYNNLLIKANSKDHRNDTIITTFNLIAALTSYYNIYIIDNLVGISISIWIFLSSIKIYKESYDILLDKSIDKKTKDQVYSLINKHPEIKKVIHFNSTPIGYLYQVSFTIYVDGNLSTFQSHKIADNLEKEIKKEISEIYLTVIHVNPD